MKLRTTTLSGMFLCSTLSFSLSSTTFASGLSCASVFQNKSIISSTGQPLKKISLPELDPNAPKAAIEGQKKLQDIINLRWPDSFLKTDFHFLFFHFSAYLGSEGNIKKQPEVLLNLLKDLKKFPPLVDLELADLVAHLLAANHPIYQVSATDAALERTLLTIMETNSLYPKFEPKLLNSGPREPTEAEINDVFERGGTSLRGAFFQAQAYTRGEFERFMKSGQIIRLGGGIDPRLILPVTIKVRREQDVINPNATGEAKYLLRSGRYFLDIFNADSILQSLELPYGDDPRFPHIAGSRNGPPQLNHFSVGKNQFLVANSDGLFSVWQAPVQNFSDWKLVATASSVPRDFKNLNGSMPKSVVGYGPINGELVLIKATNSFGLLIFGQYTNTSDAKGWYLYDLGIGALN